MVAAMLAFVTNDTLVKLASESMPLGEVLFLRGVVSLAILVPVMLMFRFEHRWRDYANPMMVWRNIADVGATLIYLTALTHLTIANATIVLQAVPLIVTIAGAVLFREHVGWRRWTAISVGLAGVVVVIRPGLEGFNAWSLAALAAVFLIAGRDIATRHVPASIPTMMLVIASVTVNLFGGAALGIGESWLWPTLEGWLTTIGAGIASVFAYLLIVVALRGRDLSLTAPFRYTVIVWAVLYGVVIWGDSLDFLTIVGACLIVASGVFMLYRERKLAQTSEENTAG